MLIAGMPSRSLQSRLSRTAACLAFANAALLTAPLVWAAADEGEGAPLIGALIAFVWTGSAPWAAAALTAASRTESGAAAFLGVELLLIASSLAVLYHFSFGHTHSTDGLIYFTGPFVQWGAFLVAVALSYAVGWRMREGWPDPA